ncbi:MAG TPA: methyltransferase [Streptosporangiaceae bacterium]|nr:methyltransferase [Streptosporangiaceae bacterium]
MTATGYADFMSCISPHGVRQAAWQRCAELVDGELRQTVGLFLLGERVPTAGLHEPVNGILPALARCGVADVTDGHARLSGLVLLFTRGVWLFVQPPQISPTLYLGDDSFALADRLALRPGSCLDLCAGPGIQTLLCAQRGHPVTAVEINPVAAALCRLNVGLNGLTGRVSVRCADLYAGVSDERFGNILANPPLLPIPNEVAYPFVGDGGPDGLRAVRRILAGLPDHLSADGQAQVIGMALSDGMLPAILDELSAFAKLATMDVTLTVTAHLPATADAAWVTGVAGTVAGHAGTPYEDAIEAVARGYEALGATHVCMYALRVRRGGGSLQYIDLSSEAGIAQWFV